MGKWIRTLFAYLAAGVIMLFATLPVNGQTISGTVNDASTGSTLPGVNILVKGTSTGTSTDSQGNFELTVESLQDTLVVSYIGYKTSEVPINGRTEIEIVLQPQTIAGEELVVVGYGEKEKGDLTGAIERVGNESLDSRPATNVASLLQGQMTGVSITQSSGQPGEENHSILIRGVGTMNSNQPLVLVDGIESSMASVNPNDIESISVLKDAASAAIYGSRAANGVILITTKRGKGEATKVSYKTYIGWQKPTSTPNYLSSAKYASLLNEALGNEGLDPRYTQEEIKKFKTGEEPFNYPNTRWLDLLLKGSGFIQNHDLSFSSGSDNTTYRISLGYNKKHGLMKKTESDNYNLLANLDSKLYDWFNVGLNTKLSQRVIINPANPFTRSAGVNQFFRQVNRIPPTVLNKYEDGSWGRHDDGNPIAWAAEGGRGKSKISNLTGSIFGEAELIKGLSLRGEASTNYTITDRKLHLKTISYGDGSVQGPNAVEDASLSNTTIKLESTLKYLRTIGKSEITGLLGVSRRQETISNLMGYRENFPNNQLSELTAGSEKGWENNGTKIESKLASYFGRINYEFNNKYIFQANIRRDGSSKFSSNKRWGWFPSFSVGWRITEEEFMNEISWLNELKLRASWGKIGNNRIGNYQYIPLITLGRNYNFGGEIANGAAQTESVNPNISWETTTGFDLGLDMALLQNKVSLTLDYYNRYTEDILATVPVSDVYGLPAPTVNAGAMRNRGVEFRITHNNMIGDFGYNISVNGTYNYNEVEKYENPSTGTYIRKEGVSWNSFYGYEAIGKFQSEKDINESPHRVGIQPKVGNLKYKDQNGDGKIDANDRIVLGNNAPEITFGLNMGVDYRGINLSLFLQGADNVNRILGSEAMWPFQNGAKAQKMHLDRTIVKDGKIINPGHYPRVTTSGQSSFYTSNHVFSSFDVLDAAYIRLKNIQLGYTLPRNWFRSTTLSKVRVYVSGENLLTITRDFPEGFDPEIPNEVRTYYPHVKTYTFGLNISL